MLLVSELNLFIFIEGKIYKWFKLFCSWSSARKWCARP